MEIFRITTEDVPLFSRLDPYGWLTLLECSNVFAYGCMTEADEDDEVQPVAGLVIASATQEELTVYWLAVGETAEGLGLGSLLLRKAFEIAVAAGIPGLKAVLGAEYEKEALSAGGEIFFEERFFTESRSVTGLWQGTLFDLLKGQAFANVPEDLPEVEALSTCSASRRAAILRQLMELDGQLSFYDISREPDACDPDISFVITEGEKVLGGLLLRRLSESLLPVYFYAYSMAESRALAVAAAKRSAGLFEEDMPVDIILTGRSVKREPSGEAAEGEVQPDAALRTLGYAASLLPEEAGVGWILSAKTEDYVNYERKSYQRI